MSEKRFKIIDKEFISYYGGYGHLISDGNCKFWLWHDESGSQKVCDKLNIIMEENEQLKHNNKMLSMKMSEVSTKYRLLKEFSDDTNPNEAVKTVLHELMMITKEYR